MKDVGDNFGRGGDPAVRLQSAEVMKAVAHVEAFLERGRTTKRYIVLAVFGDVRYQ
jgi:cobalamin-dependent methionine synthase I